MCITSDQLLKENRVVDRNVTLDLNIGEFINEYKVCHIQCASCILHLRLKPQHKWVGIDFAYI